MTLPVVLTPQAEAELDDAAQWYEQQAAGLGTDLVEAVQRTLSLIENLPELYPVAHGTLRRGLLQRFPYAVYYRVHADRIEVVAIFHHRRDPAEWQRR